MTEFRLITEGVTDQAVLESILIGCCGEDISIAPLRPLGDETYKGKKESFGGWEAVLEYCASKEFEKAFQFADYVVVHIDTDVCEETNFDVRRQEDGVELSPHNLIERVARKLQEKIGSKVWQEFHERIIFAIAVDSIECWLLPLHARESYKTRYKGCVDVLNRQLRTQNSKINLGSKKYKDYQSVSRKYSKWRTLKQCYQQNDGLQRFIEHLQERGLTSSEFKGESGDEGATETE